jgi:hypothetical protein
LLFCDVVIFYFQNLAPEPGKIDISFFDKPVATGAKTKPVEPVAKAAQAVAGPWDETDTAPLLTGW